MDPDIIQSNTNLEHVDNEKSCGERLSPHLTNKDHSLDTRNKRIFKVYVNNNLDAESILIQIKSNEEIMDSDDILANDKILHNKPNKKQPELNSQKSLPHNYIRISSNESYSIPVHIHKHQISFITVYVEDSITNKLSCICNNWQTNRRFIEI
eukprot:227670_1